MGIYYPRKQLFQPLFNINLGDFRHFLIRKKEQGQAIVKDFLLYIKISYFPSLLFSNKNLKLALLLDIYQSSMFTNFNQFIQTFFCRKSVNFCAVKHNIRVKLVYILHICMGMYTMYNT